jgi:hypothetical protein
MVWIGHDYAPAGSEDTKHLREDATWFGKMLESANREAAVETRALQGDAGSVAKHVFYWQGLISTPGACLCNKRLTDIHADHVPTRTNHLRQCPRVSARSAANINRMIAFAHLKPHEYLTCYSLMERQNALCVKALAKPFWVIILVNRLKPMRRPLLIHEHASLKEAHDKAAQ